MAGISAASIDRLLGAFKVSAGRRPRPPKPASGVKALVEMRAESWETVEPGWTEVDTVAHCDGDIGAPLNSASPIFSDLSQTAHKVPPERLPQRTGQGLGAHSPIKPVLLTHNFF